LQAAIGLSIELSHASVGLGGAAIGFGIELSHASVGLGGAAIGFGLGSLKKSVDICDGYWVCHGQTFIVKLFIVKLLWSLPNVHYASALQGQPEPVTPRPGKPAPQAR
jgi:hypothetical protein